MEFQSTVISLRDELSTCAGVSDANEIPWCWLAINATKVMGDHSSGLSRTVLLTELEAKWHREASDESLHAEIKRTVGPFYHRESKPSPEAMFGLKIDGMWSIPGSGIWLWRLSGAPDPVSSGGPVSTGNRSLKARNTADMQIDAFIHQRYYPMIEAIEFSGFFSRKRTLFATGLSVADRGGGTNGKPNQTILPTTSLVFELRIKETQGLPEGLRPFTDEPLLENIFGVQYCEGRFIRRSFPAFNADQIWCRIDHIFPPETQYRGNRLVQHQQIQCISEHEDPPRTVNVSFWDKDTAITRLFKQDNYIGLLCPIITSKQPDKTVEVEYGSQTIAFIASPIANPVSMMASQLSIAYNNLGNLDYKRYAHRVYLDRCRANMINLTVLARVVAVSENMPYVDGNDVQDRYALRVEDEKGRRDLTLWGPVGRQASQLLPGQLMLLDDLETHEEGGEVILNGSEEVNTSFYNISVMTGILTSATLCRYTCLAQVPEAANVYCKARVVKATGRAGGYMRDARDRLEATSLVHSVCKRPLVMSGASPSDGSTRSRQLENPVDFYSFDCPSCDATGLETSAVESVFVLDLCIDDGTRSVCAHIASYAANEIVGMLPLQLLQLASASEQQSALAKPVGQEFVMSLTSYCEPLSSETSFRIDAARPSSDIGVLST
ncbi:hypothetical protein EV175_002983 [Coemansia sp. RSA 1933]|nr:hypothetical protein EV175_002983 [Coemansia sp. RSA 1933]